MSKQSKVTNFVLSVVATVAVLAPVGAQQYSQGTTCTRTYQHNCCLVQPLTGYQPVGSYNNAIDPGRPTPPQYYAPAHTCRYRAQLQNAPGTFNNPIKPGEPTPGPIPLSVPTHDCCGGY